MAQVIDPTVGVRVELVDCRQCAALRNYIGVISPRTAKPFVVDMSTLESKTLDDAPADVMSAVETQRNIDDWIDSLSVVCDDVRVGLFGALGTLSESTAVLNTARSQVADWPIIETVLRAHGYTLFEIAKAYSLPESVYARRLPVNVLAQARMRMPLREGIDDAHNLKAVFLAGAGGAGKGRVAAALVGGAGLKTINADTHLERLLRDADVPLSKVGDRYDLFGKARDLRNKELRQYAMRRVGLLIDSTAWDYSRIAEPVKKLRRLGYDVYMVFVTTSLNTALARNIARGKAGGRDVPDSFISTAHRGAHENMPDYLRLFGHRNFFLIDNNRDMPDAAWDKTVGQQAAKIGREILARPVSNPAGKAWLEKQSDPERADYNKPKSLRGWDSPKTKVQFSSPLLPATGHLLDVPKSEPSGETSKPLGAAWQRAQARLDWKKKHPGKPVPPEMKD